MMRNVLPLSVMLLMAIVCQGCEESISNSTTTYFHLSDDFTIDSIDGKCFNSEDSSLNYKVDSVNVNGADAERKEVESISNELKDAIKVELVRKSSEGNIRYDLGDAKAKSGGIDYGQKLVIEFDVIVEEKASGRKIDGVYSFAIKFTDSTPPDQVLDFYLSDIVTIESIGGKNFTTDSTYLNYNVDDISPVGKDIDSVVNQLEALLRRDLDQKSVDTDSDYILGDAVLSGNIIANDKLVINFDIDIKSNTNSSKISGVYSFTIAFSDKLEPWNGFDKTKPDIDITDNYLIKIPANLAWLADQQKVDKNVLFLFNIDMGGKSFRGIKVFSGIFDGNNKIIKNININIDDDTTSMRATALIQNIVGESTIKNLTLDGGTVSGNEYIGSFVGTIGVVNETIATVGIRHKLVIDNLTSNLDIISNISSNTTFYEVVMGGLVAMIKNRDTTVTSSTYSGKIISKSRLKSIIGGVIGKILNSDITMIKLVNNNDISVAIKNTGINVIGGILGEGMIAGTDKFTVNGTGLINKGNLVNNNNSNGLVGGIIGVNSSNSDSVLKIVDTKNEGDLTGANIMGGIIGLNSDAQVVITETCNKGLIESDHLIVSDSAGGIVGSNEGESINISKSYNSGDVNGGFKRTGGIIGKNTSLSTTDITDNYNDGAITGNMYTGGIIGYNSIDLTMTMLNTYNRGIISGSSSGYLYIGGLIGSNNASKTQLSNSYNIGKLTTNTKISNAPLTVSIGGLIGRSLSSTNINNTYNIGDIDTDISAPVVAIGGLVGFGSALTISESYNKGDIISRHNIGTVVPIPENYIGGIVGSIIDESTANKNSLVKVVDSYNSGDVEGIGILGGVVGDNYYYGLNSNKLEISNSFSYGEVKAGINAGAIIGRINESTTTATYTNNYWYALGTPASDTIQLGGNRLEVDEFMLAESFTDWRVNEDGTIWEILKGAKYPTLVNNKEVVVPPIIITP